ncbi:MAG TPA: DEAD/DEAH box helicase [Candidatus Cloacimonadota bacterium]|nr:DEAD/DEAH box helicase [Candidatus Cloacimonadota bacterium]
MTKFTDLTLPEPILRAARDLGFEKPTPVQALTIPWLLENNSDLIALAQTGTGKTAAFGFPLLSNTDIESKSVQSLILCPTRELCLQITKDLQAYAKYLPRVKMVAVYGGAPIYKQKEALLAGAHIVVGTPGRVNDMIRQNVLHLQEVNQLVLDEADEMLNMGFKDELFEIMSHIPESKQTMLFSATMPKDVEHLANSFMKGATRLSAGGEDKGAENIEHFFYKVQARDKYLALKRIADMSPKIYGIIFCRTRNETQDIANKLQQDGYNADALHGDLSQAQREMVMQRFRSKYVQLLVATDVAARGLDVDDLSHIINYHIPTDPDIYIHRSGRTGRAGKSGISISIMHSKEAGALKAVEKRLGREITWQKVPGGREICQKQLFHFIDSVEKVEVDEEQIGTFLSNVYKKLSWMTREELIQRFVAVEFNRFLNYYKDIPDLDNPVQAKRQEAKKDFKFSTFRLNLGSKHGLTKRDLMRYVNQLKVSRGIEIGQINIFGDYCLIELDSNYESELLQAFVSNKYKGVTVEASVGKAPKTQHSSKDDWKERRKTRKIDDYVDHDTTYYGRNIWEGTPKKGKDKPGFKGKKKIAPDSKTKRKKTP